MQKKRYLISIIILILIAQWSTLTAQSRDDRIKEVITDYINIINQSSNVIKKLDNELFTKDMVITNLYAVLNTERDLHNIDLKIQRVKSAKRVMIAGGVGAVVMGVIIGGLKYILR